MTGDIITRDDIGKRVKVVISQERPQSTPPYGWERETITDHGTITAVPSRKFDRPSDGHDFDYQLDQGAVRSVDLDTDTVDQLAYDAGGDRDFESFRLESITIEP